MFLVAKDDPITKFKDVPFDKLAANPNFIVGITNAGGHCEFFFKKDGKHQRYVPSVLLNFFDQLQKFD